MTPDEKLAFARSFPVQVGVDTGKRFHVLVARGPDGRRSKPHKVLVSRAGFDAALVQLRAWFPTLTPAQMLVGLEFAGHHGFTFAHCLAQAAPHTSSPNCSLSRAGDAPFEARAPSLRWLGWLVRISQAPVIVADARFPARCGSSYRMTLASLRRHSVLAGDDVGFSTSVRDDLLARYADDPWEWAFLYSANVA